MLDEQLSKSSLSQTKGGRKFLVKHRVPDDAKPPKNMTALPGLPNVLIQASLSGSQFHKPNSSQTDTRKNNKEQKKMNQSFSNQSKGHATLKSSDDNEPHLSEINEHSEEEEQRHQIDGPQLKMEKEYIAFLTPTDEVGFDDLLVWNNGSASIYYEWKRIHGSRISSNSLQDTNEERFFCHHEQNVIKPGEQIKFVFSFLSKVTGVFNEEWYLKCEPPAHEPLPNLKLCGQATTQDGLIEWRSEYENELNKEFTLKVVGEVVGDILGNVRTPTPPPPDLDDPEQCKVEFEELNQQERLWYSKEVVNLFRSSHEEIAVATRKQELWNLDTSVLWRQLDDVDEDDGREFIERKLHIWRRLARKPPIERSSVFTAAHRILTDVALSIPEMADGLRKELEMWDVTWREDEDPKVKADELQKTKAEWLKKAKKKKWNDDMERELVEEYRRKLTERVGNAVLEQSLRLATEGELLRVQQLLTPALKWDYFRRMRVDYSYWDLWMRKKTIVDADIEGKRVAIKVHLKLTEGAGQLKLQFEEQLLKQKEEEEKRLEEERLERERIAKENSKKKGKGKPQPPQQQAGKQKVQEEQRPVEQKQELLHIDPECLNEILEMVRNLLERQAKLVVLIVSYDRPWGRFRLTSGVKFFYEWLKQRLEQPVYFSESHIVENFEENVENQIWSDNSAVVLENIFFEPLETGTFIDEEGNVYPTEEPDIEALTPYRRLLPYSPIYILADKVNFFSSQLPSINSFSADQIVLGTNILRDVQTVIYNIQGMNGRHGVVIIGGDLTPDKLLAIDTLVAHCSSIILLGRIGFAFFCTMFDVDSDLVPPLHRKVIKQMIDCFSNEMTIKPPEKLKRISHVAPPPRPRAKLICPLDFLVTRIPEGQYDAANPDHVALVLNSITPYVLSEQGGRKVFDLRADQLLLDYGPETIARVQEEVLAAQRVVWFDTANLGIHNIQKTMTIPDLEAIALLQKLQKEEAIREQERLERLKDKKASKTTKKQPIQEEKKVVIDIKTTKEINVPVFNETNRTLGQLIFEVQQEKRSLHEKAQKNSTNHNYEQDCVITMVGSRLEEEMNREDFAAMIKVNMDQQQPDEQVDVNEEGDKQSQASLQQQQEVQKVNQVKQYLSDYFVRDQEFVLQVLAGHHIPCLNTIDEYAKKSNSEIDEEQFFEHDNDESP